MAKPALVEINRFQYTPHVTLGQIILNDFKCLSLELPYLDNCPYYSCIPTGTYRAKKEIFNAGNYPTIEIIVPGRTLIKIHKGNSVDDILGCILTGYGYLYNGGRVEIYPDTSGTAFNDFYSKFLSLHTEEVFVSVKDCKPQF